MRSTYSLLESIRSDISSGNTDGLFNTIANLDQDELKTLWGCFDKVSDVIGSLPTLNAVAGIYDEIARYVREAFDRYEITPKKLFIDMLDAISILHVTSHFHDCTSIIHPYFMLRNRRHFAFWRWFRAHAPADLKIMSLREFDFPPEFVLPNILISNPHDLRFYKEFCIDLKTREPLWYDWLSIEPVVRDAIIRKAIAIEEGKTLPRCAVPMSMVKNNFFIADYLR